MTHGCKAAVMDTVTSLMRRCITTSVRVGHTRLRARFGSTRLGLRCKERETSPVRRPLHTTDHGPGVPGNRGAVVLGRATWARAFLQLALRR